MKSKGNSRRAFLLSSVTGLNTAWIASNYTGILAAQQFSKKAVEDGKLRLTVLSDAQAAEVEAMAAQIIPTDESPGAREAHCIYFIDRALATFSKASQPLYIQGVQDLQAKAQELYPSGAKFSTLTSEQQIKVLRAIEKTPFFQSVRVHTILGFFSRPVHGGNYNQIGWKLIGYEDSLNHKPPFGYYDAQELSGGQA